MPLFTLAKRVLFGKKQIPTDLPVDGTPDLPVAFGYKTAWLAIPDTPENIMSHIGASDIQSANWASGLNIANGKQGYVFVSPQVNGWTFIVGYALNAQIGTARNDSDTKEAFRFFHNIALRVPDFSYFHSDRISESHAWVRYTEGTLKRALFYADDEIYYQEGVLDAAEKSLPCYHNLEVDEDDEEITYMFIDEDDVMTLASHWSMAPIDLENITSKPAVGYVCRLT